MRCFAVAALCGLLACGSDDPPGTAPPCTRDEECESGACLSLATGSRCGALCEGSQQCEADEVCAPVLRSGGVATACLPSPDGGPVGAVCAADAECADGVCHESLCVQLCGTCPGNEVCAQTVLRRFDHDIDTGVCLPGPPAADLELGPALTTDQGSEEIIIEIPADLVSFTITLVGEGDEYLGIHSLTAPDGSVLVDQAAALDFRFINAGTTGVRVPFSDLPGSEPQPGSYRLRVGTYLVSAAPSATLTAGRVTRGVVTFERRGEEGGTLDLEVHLAPALGMSAETAATQPLVIDLLATATRLLQTHGLVHVGSVGYHDLTSDHDFVEDGTEARGLFRDLAVPGEHGNAVNVFVVADVAFASGYTGNTPGPPAIFGTTGSGVVIEVLDSGPHTGMLLAHELGHFLGLHHTTAIGAFHDDISDTPECESGTVIQECPDFENLMFPFFPLTERLALTAGQRKVLRGSPSLYETVLPEACAGAPATVDVTEGGFATADTVGWADLFAGSCGGAGAPERVQLVRIGEQGGTLDLHAQGADFAPVVYVRRGACEDDAEELACAAADAGTDLPIHLDGLAPGAYFVIVDGREGAGTYSLSAAVSGG